MHVLRHIGAHKRRQTDRQATDGRERTECQRDTQIDRETNRLTDKRYRQTERRFLVKIIIVLNNLK